MIVRHHAHQVNSASSVPPYIIVCDVCIAWLHLGEVTTLPVIVEAVIGYEIAMSCEYVNTITARFTTIAFTFGIMGAVIAYCAVAHTYQSHSHGSCIHGVNTVVVHFAVVYGVPVCIVLNEDSIAKFPHF